MKRGYRRAAPHHRAQPGGMQQHLVRLRGDGAAELRRSSADGVGLAGTRAPASTGTTTPFGRGTPRTRRITASIANTGNYGGCGDESVCAPLVIQTASLTQGFQAAVDVAEGGDLLVGPI